MRTLTFRVPAASLAYWDAAAHRWVVEEGPLRLEVGASSADVRRTATVRVVRRH